METALKYIEVAFGNIKHRTDRERIQPRSSNITVDENKSNNQLSSPENTCTSTAKECNFVKFINTFKDFKVTRMCKSCKWLGLGIRNETSTVSASPTAKKRKLLNDPLQCKGFSNDKSSTNQTQILIVEDTIFKDYLSLINFAGPIVENSPESKPSDTVDNSIHNEAEEHSLSDAVNMSSASNFDQEETFLHMIVNAVLNSNVIEQISRNILN